MEIEIFTLSDYAENFNGRLVIGGTFDLIGAAMFPTNHPSCALSLKMRFGEKEIGKHSLQLRLIDSNGNNIIPDLNTQVEVLAAQNGVSYSGVCCVFKLANVRFPSIGRYSFELYVDNEWTSALPINLMQMLPQVKAA